MSSVDSIVGMKARILTIMATRSQDQDLVAKVAEQHVLKEAEIDDINVHGRVVPSFGWHPWFSHEIYDDRDSSSGQTINPPEKIAHYTSVLTPEPDDHEFIFALPEPRPLSAYLAQLKDRLKTYPLALVGEVGLDRAFRIPQEWIAGHAQERDPSLTPGGREGRGLSPYRVALDHQRKILVAQLNLAGEMCRAVSLHGVQAHGFLFETVRDTWKGYERKGVSKREKKKRANAEATSTRKEEPDMQDDTRVGLLPFPPRLCLHSYSGPTDTLRQYFHPSVPVEVYVSFSMAINFSNRASGKLAQVIKAVPNNRILVESDLHCAGERMDDLLEQVARTICTIKGWSLADGVTQMAMNWRQFVFGRGSETEKQS